MELTPSDKCNEIDFKKFKSYATEQLKLFNNVGIAISIFSNNKILFEEGIGYKDNSKKLLFTPRTLFPIGSHTKSITATAMAMLIDEGLSDWEKPIREYIPVFKLKDALASEKATIKDVLSHTTGLPHHQFTFMNSEWNYKDIFKRLPHLDPLFDFRTRHKYSNLNYFIVTKIIEELSGKSYFSFIKDRIFTPLSMKSTNFSINETYKMGDYTKGYKESENGFVEEEYLDLQYISAGAGSINSCLEDMSKWIQFHLNKGKVNGKQLISEKTLNNLYIQQKLDNNPFIAIIPEKNFFTNYGYALGWWNLDYRGTKIIQHYGTGPGLIFNGGFMPYNNIGFVIFSNTTGSDIPFYLNFHIADQILGLEPYDMGSKLKEFNDLQQAAITKGKEAEKELKKDTKPSHPLEEFVGKYNHPGYGVLEFYLEDNEFKVKYGDGLKRKLAVEHHIYNTFKLTVLGPFGVSLFATFMADFQGKIKSIEVNAEPSLKPAIFEKISK